MQYAWLASRTPPLQTQCNKFYGSVLRFGWCASMPRPHNHRRSTLQQGAYPLFEPGCSPSLQRGGACCNHRRTPAGCRSNGAWRSMGGTNGTIQYQPQQFCHFTEGMIMSGRENPQSDLSSRRGEHDGIRPPPQDGRKHGGRQAHGRGGSPSLPILYWQHCHPSQMTAYFLFRKNRSELASVWSSSSTLNVVPK